MEKICGIYKITSPTGRVYIGQSVDIEFRWKGYKRGCNVNSQVRLRNSFSKYNVLNHTFEVVEVCSIEELNCRERYWQDFYNVLNGGLNCILQECASYSRVFSQETKQKMSKSQKKKILTALHKENIKKNHNTLKDNYVHWNTGKKLSEKTIDKIKKSSNKLSVLQYNFEGYFINSFSSAADAENFLHTGIKTGNIVKCCNNKRKSYKGYIWKYGDVNNTPLKIESYSRSGHTLLIYLEGILSHKVGTFLEAERITGVSRKTIKRIVGTKRESKKYSFNYEGK